MWRKHDPYEARTEEERQRNLARLGTRWQGKPRRPLTEREQPWQEKMDIWRARDAYHAQTLLWVLGGIGLVVLILVLGALLEGCALWFEHTHAQVSRTLDVPEPPDAAFAQAVRVTMQMGGTLWQQDAKSRTLQAFMQAKTRLDVSVEPHGQGSRLHVAHQNLPTYVAAGEDGTLSEEFLTRYAQQAARR